MRNEKFDHFAIRFLYYFARATVKGSVQFLFLSVQLWSPFKPENFQAFLPLLLK
mgnify:CR=1 FL=1